MRQEINNGDSGLSVRNAINAMTLELYSAITLPIKLPNVSVNTNLIVPENTFVDKLGITIISGTPSINIGTTPNGGEILNGEYSTINLIQTPYPNQVTYYITISGGVASFRFDVINNYN